MSGHLTISFPPYTLDFSAGTLLRGDDEIKLRPKTFSVLSVLVQNPGQLVTIENLMHSVWGNVIVSSQAPRNCVRELRQVLGDTSRKAEFIQTVHGRGYRLIAPVSGPVASKGKLDQSPLVPRTTTLVDRDEPLAKLAGHLDLALRASRQLVFVTGEAGIGKSALVEYFLDHGLPTQTLLVGRGQCVEHHSGGDAYLPFIEALIDACRTARFDAAGLFEKFAPSWYRGFPTAYSRNIPDLSRAQPIQQGSRTLLEIAEALEIIAASYPILLVLEDLQWADKDTLGLLVHIARRRPAARLLIACTYRSEDVIGHAHPIPSLKQELLIHGHCANIALHPLTVQGVESYLEHRFRPADPQLELTQLASKVHERTDGNPLFMTELMQHFLDQGYLTMEDAHWRFDHDLDSAVGEIPDDVRLFIDEQVNRLQAEQRLILEIASQVGTVFSARLITDLVEYSAPDLEEMFSELAERDYILEYGDERILDDGTVVQRFRFIHNLHQETLSRRIPMAKRIRMLRAIGERIEDLYAGDTSPVLGELASLFERGKEFSKAARYLLLHARHLNNLGASHEALRQLARGSELSNLIRDAQQRDAIQASLEELRKKVYSGGE